MKYDKLYERLQEYKKKSGYQTKQQKAYRKKYQSLLVFKVYPMASQIVRARGFKLGPLIRKLERLHQDEKLYGIITKRAYNIVKRG